MPAIPQEVAKTMFQTVLTNDDKATLQDISEYQVDIMKTALEQEDYATADRCWGPLNQLQIIGRQRIAGLMGEVVRIHVQTYAETRVAAFNRHAAAHQFTEAEQILITLRALHAHFPGEDLVGLEDLVVTLQTARTQHTAQQEVDERQRRAEEGVQEAEGRQRRAEEEVQKAEIRQQEAKKEAQEAEEIRQQESKARQRSEEETQRTEEERRKARREREEMEARVRRQEAVLAEERDEGTESLAVRQQ